MTIIIKNPNHLFGRYYKWAIKKNSVEHFLINMTIPLVKKFPYDHEQGETHNLNNSDLANIIYIKK